MDRTLTADIVEKISDKTKHIPLPEITGDRHVHNTRTTRTVKYELFCYACEDLFNATTDQPAEGLTVQCTNCKQLVKVNESTSEQD